MTQMQLFVTILMLVCFFFGLALGYLIGKGRRSEMSEFESCTGCWYAEHGDCSLGNEPCHEKKQDFSELNPMHPEIESEMGMPSDGMGSWWYRCPMCHDPLDYRQKECSWCHLKIDWEGR